MQEAADVWGVSAPWGGSVAKGDAVWGVSDMDLVLAVDNSSDAGQLDPLPVLCEELADTGVLVIAGSGKSGWFGGEVGGHG